MEIFLLLSRYIIECPYAHESFFPSLMLNNVVLNFSFYTATANPNSADEMELSYLNLTSFQINSKKWDPLTQ